MNKDVAPVSSAKFCISKFLCEFEFQACRLQGHSVVIIDLGHLCGSKQGYRLNKSSINLRVFWVLMPTEISHGTNYALF